jgi:hypothetical protein
MKVSSAYHVIERISKKEENKMPTAGGILGGTIIEQLARFVGTTVTIYTTSGGQSGCGFTGVLVCVDPCFIKLITCIGPAPCCPLGSACTGGRLGCGGGGFGYGNFTGGPFINNVGSVVVIPLHAIAGYVHNAI